MAPTTVHPWVQLGRCVLVPAILLVLAATGDGNCFAQPDEESQYRPGLIGQYQTADQTICRVDEAVVFDWTGPSPDPRLPAGDFNVRWTGKLFVLAGGTYRLRVFGAGEFELALGGAPLLSGRAAEAVWHAGQPVELSYGYVSLDLRYRATGPQRRVALYWEGPQFSLEPIPQRHLFHDPQETPEGHFERGALLVRALRCGACHEFAGRAEIHPAPALVHAADAFDPQWLTRWLQEQPRHLAGPGQAEQERRDEARTMPGFAMSEADAAAIVSYLVANSKPLASLSAPVSTVDAARDDQRRPADRDQKASGQENSAGQPGEDATAAKIQVVDQDSQDSANSQAPAKNKPPKPRPPSAQIGQRLLLTLGCLACHRVDELGTAGLFSGGDLARVAEKRPSAFFDRWLQDPASINPAHRMPVFSLAAQERADLAAYLITLRSRDVSDAKRVRSPHASADQLSRGRALVAQWRCGNCHALPEGAPPPAPMAHRKLHGQSRWDESCLGAAQASEPHRHRPAYGLPAGERTAIRTFVSQYTAGDQSWPARGARGRLVLEERNCLGCHAREHAPGIEPLAVQVSGKYPALASLLPGMKPPALFAVGDKLHDEALRDAILARSGPRRPWLAIRMPRFNLPDDEQAALVEYFVQADRVPPSDIKTHPAGAPARHDPAALRLAGSRLVTSDGFGCTSCHAVGSTEPDTIELKSRGPNLALIGQRMRREFYNRWMSNPARIVPRMEMPSLVSPIQGVLDNDLSTQLSAVWHVLNEPGFNPPQPNPVRVVRCRNQPGTNERANVLTDVLLVGSRELVKPLLIGLPNRHNVLFDLETSSLAGWWMGDTARQRTRGKTWYWEAGGENLFDPSGQVELALLRDGKVLLPQVIGQFPSEFDWFEHLPLGVRFGQRLRFSAVAGGQPITVMLTQTLIPAAETAARSHAQAHPPAAVLHRGTGFHRRIQIEGVPAGWVASLRIFPPPTGKLEQAGNIARIESERATWQVELRAPAGLEFEPPVHAARQPADPPPSRSQWRVTSTGIVLLPAQGNAPLVCEAVYRTSLPVDQILAQPLPLPKLQPRPMNVVPGYEAVRLPLDPSIMPTALAWRPDGVLAVASLKGQVFLARDTDGDGLEDALTPFSDELAAPYGLAAQGKSLDVLNKYALLRLHDQDADGRADRTETLASGWGHTRDYHDWAVGLPRDAQGCYYIALPCQQDDRSPAAAHLRGQAIRLVPKTPSREDPRSFALEPFCGGLRFPMGLALSREGELFATDNQGNYNPFNELNHLQPGRRYGFINKLEQRPGFQPELTPPAIDIPHPFTRSVNGIGFLYTPPTVRQALGRDLFGPFEGHLLGCEYDTRRLVRMSLQRVGGVFQGAVYPFSHTPPQAEPLEGPVVCEVAPDGDLYIGNLRDSGWGGGNNTGSLVRLRPAGELPAGIAEVRAVPGGLQVLFTAPVDAELAARPASYFLASYRRTSTPAYGGPDEDRREEKIFAVRLSPDLRSATLTLDELREGFVYELQVKNLAPEGQKFFPAEAHYTLRKKP
jgi:hypothetical protein